MLSTDMYDGYGVGQSTASNSDPWTFGAQWGYFTDRETGLLLLTNRYYDPGTGRFVTRDPAGYGGGINLYGYVGNGPASGVDPLGLDDDLPWYDYGYSYHASNVAYAKEYINQHWATGPLGIAGATLVNSFMDLGLSALAIPSMLGHYGEGAGCFAGHPSLETLPGLINDINTTLDIALIIAGGAEAGRTGPGCFVAGTPVVMADGSAKPIERIKAGDQVQARDPNTGRVVTGRVQRTFMHNVDHTVLLTLPSGEQIETTENHPFFVEGRGWVPAGELGIGTQILTRAGPALSVARLERRWEPARVFNFEVEGLHCYFVGGSEGGLCVHNAGDCGPPAEHVLEEHENVPHYRPNPLGEEPYRLYRRAAGGGWSAYQDYDTEGYAVRRADLLSRSGRMDHEFPHHHEIEWEPNARKPGGASRIGKPIPGLPPGG